MFFKNCGNKINEGEKFCINLSIIIAIVAIVLFVLLGFWLFNKFKSSKKFNNSAPTVETNSDNIFKQISNTKSVTEYGIDTTVDQMNTVTFGSYPQSDITGNTKDPIEWLVLEKGNGKALLLSKYILDCKCYNDSVKDITWENSTLRNWLNNTFYNKAFNDEEKLNIQLTNVINSDNVEYGTKGGNETKDKLFCLSIDETKKYFYQNDMFIDNKRLATRGTKYAQNVDNTGSKLLVNKSSEWYNGNSYFWLRSSGDYQYSGAGVDFRGFLGSYGYFADAHGLGVRVALWVNYSDTNENSAYTSN